MEDDREDGEISDNDSNECEDVEVYNPIVRPVSNVIEARHVRASVPSSEDESSSSDSDSESEFTSKPKRQKTKCIQMDAGRNGQQDHQSGRRKNNIWASVLQEEELVAIGGVGLKKIKSDRNVESYDYTQALKLFDNNKEDKEEELIEYEETEEDVQKRLTRKRRFCDNSGENRKKGKKHSGARYLADIVLEEDWDSQHLGTMIADALHEQKPELIIKVVEVLGHQKALDLYQSTQKLEKDGGMMIHNGSRRRTSGGIYLLLLKTFDGVTSDHISKIFMEDDKEEQLWRKRMRAKRRRQKHQHKRMEGDDTETKIEEDGFHLKGLFSDDPGGTKCPGSTPVTSPTTSDNEDIENSSPSKITPNQTLLHLKEVCEKAASEIIFRDKTEEGEFIDDEEITSIRQDEMETC